MYIYTIIIILTYITEHLIKSFYKHSKTEKE